MFNIEEDCFLKKLDDFYLKNTGSRTLRTIIRIINPMIYSGFRLILLAYSSLNLTSPPYPPGRFTPVFAINY